MTKAAPIQARKKTDPLTNLVQKNEADLMDTRCW